MNHTVPTWLARLLGIRAEAGEGAAWSLEYLWPLPPWATLLLAALAVAFVVAVYLREGRNIARRLRLTLAAMRLVLIAIVALMIAQVTLSLERTGLPYVAVVIDDSLSMTVVDHFAEKPHGATRWSLAESLLTGDGGAWLGRIAEGHKLRVSYLTGPRASSRQDVPGIVEELRSLSPTGDVTRLGGGIRSVLDELRGAPPVAIVSLTDGINTDGPTLGDAAQFARRRGVPLYFVGIGSDRPTPELKLSDLLVDDVVFVEDVVHFECKLTATGYEGKKLTITLSEKGKPAVLAKTQVAAGPDGRPQPIRLSYRPTQVGQFEYVVAIEPPNGDKNTMSPESTRLSRVVQVRKEKIRVLLVQAYPNFEFRYLRNMLERDDTIALKTVLQDADPEAIEQDPSALRAIPSKRDDLFAYDVVILGDADPEMMDRAAIKNLADFVDQPAKGGALVLIAGPSFMPSDYRTSPLARLFPFPSERASYPNTAKAITEPFVVRPTDLGLAAPAMQLGETLEETEAIWRGLAPVDWLLPLPVLKPGVRVLAEHPTRVGPDGRRLPVICLQYVGAGKVLFHATDETWRWRYRVGDEYFARYWVQTIRYLCRSKLADAGGQASLLTDRREYTQGEPVRFRVRFADERQAPAEDEGVTLAVEQTGRKGERIRLRRTEGSRGVFEGTLDHPAPGSYHVWIAEPTLKGQSPSTDFSVTPPAGEFAHTRMDATEMRRAAEATGGRYYSISDARNLATDLPPGRQSPLEPLPPIPLWNRWPVLALFLALLIGEWILRKRFGMV